MATNSDDIFAPFRVSQGDEAAPPPPAGAPPATAPDVFAPFRVDQGPRPDIRREDNTLGEEFRAGLGAGIDSMQGSLFGVAGLVGRELGIDWLENAGNKGAQEQFGEAAAATRQSAGFTDIDSAGGFFRWTAASLGEAIPSLATAMSGSGIGVAVGKKSIELGVKRSLAKNVERRLTKMGFTREESLIAAREYMESSTGQTALARAFINGERVIAPAATSARNVGAAGGAVAASIPPQVGAIDQELVSAGIVDPGLTALIGGIAGGALEALPAIRLMSKMFPGVNKQVSKAFVKDFAVATGTQFALEGGTEAAQEMIQLAAMAYHDPTFDMFSPDARKRVIDAFAAGALVGAVTGGGAEAIGNIGAGARDVKRVAKPTIDKWVLDAGAVAAATQQKVQGAAEGLQSRAEEALPEGFVAADNTVFQEIRDRVFDTVQPQIESAVNSLRNQFQNIVDVIDDNLEGGVNPETAKFSQLIAAAHNQFIEDHKRQIADAKAFLNKQTTFIAETAAQMKDPATRQKFVDDNVEAVKEKLAGFVDSLRRDAAKRDQKVTAEVDNMEFDEGILDELGVEDQIDETERRVGPSGRTFERSVGPAPEPQVSRGLPTQEAGEVESAVALTFGKFQKTPTVDVSGKESVQGFDTETQAKKGLETLRKEFPESTDDDFQIVVQDDGTFVVESQNQDLKETQRFREAIQVARDSASRTKNNDRNNRRKFRLPRKVIEKLGLKIKNPVVDIITLANRGRNIDPNAVTLQDGLQAMVGEMLTRGFLDSDSASALLAQFEENFGTEADLTLEEFAPVGRFPTKGVAQAEMINFIGRMKERGITMPFNMLNVRENEDGTWGYGIDDPKLFRALRAKTPEAAATLQTALKDQRRQDALAQGAQEDNEFSGNAVLTEGGDIGDTRGATAGSARTTTDPIRTGRAGGDRTSGVQTGTQQQTETGGQQVTPNVRDTDPQSDDQRTNPATKPREFGDRSDPSVRNRKRRENQNARELSEDDRRILKIIARTAKTKVLFGNDAATDGALTKGVKDIVTFVQNKLGLRNDIIVMDDAGLQNLIDSGAVSDPVFLETLENPNVHARNIRIGDKSYIYLSPKTLQNDALTVLALGHELGHHLYSVAFDKLTPAARTRLRDAYEATLPSDLAATDADFNEWMADQLAAWITQRRAPKGAVEGFFARVGGQIRRLYDFIQGKGAERFTLDQTFNEFADAVAQRATEGQSPGANPLSDQAQRAWFANEGVTMYSFWGKLPKKDNMHVPVELSAMTDNSKQAVARIKAKYPKVVARAITLRNWVGSAFKVAVAPSTGVVRSIGARIKSANKLVNIFNRSAQGDAKTSQNYHQRTHLMQGQFMDSYDNITEGLDQNAREQLAKDLSRADRTKNDSHLDETGKKIRALFDAMHDYATKAGLPVQRVVNYFPRAFSRELLINNEEKILGHLMRNGFSVQKARSFFNSLVDPSAQDGRATFDTTETPGFKNMNSRTAIDSFFDQFLDTNVDGIVSNYINAVTKRAEFNRLLGEAMPATELTVKEAIKSGLWDPKANMHKILTDAKKEGATPEELTLLEKYIDANLGQMGRDDISPGVRKFMAGVMAYQNMRVLLFTVFASLPDLAGPAIRSGDMRGAWKSIKTNMHSLATDNNALADMARAYGIISREANNHIMTEYVDNHYMPPKLRAWNDAFFKWTGLNWYTDFTRKAALSVGLDYLENSYNTFLNGTEKEQFTARDRLKEFGLDPIDVKRWLVEGKPTFNSITNNKHEKIAEALVQFVDESIMRPNASQRPLLASHPAAMLVFHLKGYLYAVHDIILKRIAFNIKESDNPSQYAAAIAPAIAMMLLTAVGLELRELVQYAGSNRKPPTDRMDGWEYTFELMQRSGLTGIAQLGIDLEGAEDRGMSHVAGIGGPTLSQIGQILSKPHTQTIPKAIPVIGQIPALRAGVRKAL